MGRYANLEVRRVGCDLSRPGYMEHIIKATNDIDVGIVFNNAGYVTTGFFADVSLERHLCNNECNSTCAVRSPLF
jgi:short-subunit dehydrogenase